MAATASFAQTTTGQPGFQITGNLNAGYVSQDYYGTKVSGFEQNGMGTSLIAFRGLEDLGGGLKAHFLHVTDIQFMTAAGDQGVAPAHVGDVGAAPAVTTNNAGAVGTFGNDQKLVGIAGDFGTVNFGAINNSSLYNGIVMFNPVAGTSYASGFGSIICATVACAGPNAVRNDNTLEYKSPVISGFQAFVQYSPKQNKSVQTTTTSNWTPGLGLQNYMGTTEISAKYANGPLAVAVTRYENDATGVGNVAPASQVKSHLNTLAGAYDLGNGLRVAAIYQQYLKNSTTAASVSDRTTTGLNAYYTMGANTFGLTYGQAKENNAARTSGGLAGIANYGGQTSKFSGLHYKYALSKMTSLEAKYENLDDAAGTTTAPYQVTRTNNTRVRSTIGLNMNF